MKAFEKWLEEVHETMMDSFAEFVNDPDINIDGHHDWPEEKMKAMFNEWKEAHGKGDEVTCPVLLRMLLTPIPTSFDWHGNLVLGKGR